MKKKIVVTIISIMSVIILLAVSFSLYWTLPLSVFKTTSTSLTYNKESNSITIPDNQLKILQLTDLHANNALDMPITFSMIKKIVYKTEPDLIVFTGDVFSSGSSKNTVTRFINFIQSFNIPWTVIWGNHDDETPYSMNELSKIFEDAKNSLFKTGNLTDLYGNYFYNVSFQDGNLFQLIFMDSRHYGFTNESVDFYVQSVESTKTLNNGQYLNNFVFFHIPISELNMAINEYEKNQNIGTGQIKESPSVQENNVYIFDKIVEYNATKALIFGHDHINNIKIKYQNIDFCYGIKTGPSAYNDSKLQGGTLYTLNSDGTYIHTDIFV